MSLMLPVLQYDEDDHADDKATTDTVIERYVVATTPQQPTTKPNSSSSSSNSNSELPGARKPAVARARKAITIQQQPSQRDEAQSDVSSRPDVLQALTKERKRRAFIGMLKLLEHGAKDMSQLQLLVSPMSDEELLQVAQERALAGKCGNPLCTKPYEPGMASIKYRMSAGELHLSSASLDSDCYCSKSCSSFTQQLAAQLVNPMERLKPSVLQKALQGPSHKPQLQQQGVGAQGGGVTTMKAVIEERPAYQLIHEAESAGRALDEAAAAVGGDSTAAAAVEGYIPRQAPSTRSKQQQQQQQQGSILADATEDVLQLQPVLQRSPKQQQQEEREEQQAGASSSNEQPPAAAVVSGPQQSADDLQQYLKVFREHQEQKLQQIQQQQPSTAIDSSSNRQEASGPQQQQQQPPQQQQQQPGKEQSNEQQTDRQQEGQQQQRRVRFAPVVAFTCPAEPTQHHQQQQEQEQPVLTFTFTQGDSNSSSGAGTAGAAGGDLVGELQLTTVDDLDPDLQKAVEAEAGPATDGNSLSDQQQQQQQLPEAWKLFLPPALGGVGVPVKQVVEAQGSKGGHKKQQHRQHQQQRHQQHVTDAATSSSRSSNGAASSDASGNASQAAVSAAGTSSAQAAAPAAATPNAAAASSTGSGKPRKFSPLVRPRRSVVVLDEVPGVLLQQRGVRPGARPAAGAGAADGAGSMGSTAAVGEPSGAAAFAAADQTIAAQARFVQQQQVTSSSSVAPRASPYGNTLRSFNSSSKKNQVVRIGPLRDQGSSSSGTHSNGIPSTAHHDPENEYNSESDSEGDTTDMSDQEQWYYEDAGGSSSKGNARQQRSSSSSKCAAAGEGDVWDSDVSESEREGQSENGDSAKDVEGSDNEGGVGLGAEGLTEQAAKEALDSLMPFFDTQGITVTLSEFGLVWNQLHAWVSPATVAYVGDRRAGTGSSSSSSSGCDGGSSSNGVAGGTAAAAEQGTTSMAVIQQRIALTNLLMAAVPSVTQQLSSSVPEAQISKHISALVRSFYMPGPLPALQARHWQLLVTLMLGALSAWQLPVLRPVFKRGQAGDSVLSVLLQQLGSDVDRFWALMDLFELEV